MRAQQLSKCCGRDVAGLRLHTPLSTSHESWIRRRLRGHTATRATRKLPSSIRFACALLRPPQVLERFLNDDGDMHRLHLTGAELSRQVSMKPGDLSRLSSGLVRTVQLSKRACLLTSALSKLWILIPSFVTTTPLHTHMPVQTRTAGQ